MNFNLSFLSTQRRLDGAWRGKERPRSTNQPPPPPTPALPSSPPFPGPPLLDISSRRGILSCACSGRAAGNIRRLRAPWIPRAFRVAPRAFWAPRVRWASGAPGALLLVLMQRRRGGRHELSSAVIRLRHRARRSHRPTAPTPPPSSASFATPATGARKAFSRRRGRGIGISAFCPRVSRIRRTPSISSNTATVSGVLRNALSGCAAVGAGGRCYGDENIALDGLDRAADSDSGGGGSGSVD